jgi:putative GTP pyrophosphokinase
MEPVGGGTVVSRDDALGDLGRLGARIEESSPEALRVFKAFRDGVARFMLSYQFGIQELMTKINILAAEFTHLHDYSPIEHVKSRVKTPESIFDKAQRKGYALDFESLRTHMRDIAGIRITCSFIEDCYKVADMLTGQHDVTVLDVKDYIAQPKPNGYKSLHLILTVPVFLSQSIESVPVELQIRTVAMDFWASLEHKIYYKYGAGAPAEVRAELQEAAAVANNLDETMARLHARVRDAGTPPPAPDDGSPKSSLDPLTP